MAFDCAGKKLKLEALFSGEERNVDHVVPIVRSR